MPNLQHLDATSSATSSPPDTLVVQQRYQLIRKIGIGGMAEVFSAIARGPGGFRRTCVVKRILPELAHSPVFVQMFIDEARISSLFCHPNIVRLYEFGETEGFCFLTMERVLGRDLSVVVYRLLQDGRLLEPLVAADIARQCCLGLSYAHTLAGSGGKPLGIVHRDVTPSNVMVGFDGVVKLLDFGIARASDEARNSHTQVGVIKGKVAYVSPEQLGGQPADSRSDIFSLGIVLHELLTGTRLFGGETDLQKMRKILAMPISPPSRTNGAVPKELDRIVLRALEREPERRYQAAAEMAAELEAFLARHRHANRAAVSRLMCELFATEAAAAGFSSPETETDDLENTTIAVKEADVIAEGDARMAPTGGWRWLMPLRRRALMTAAGAAIGAIFALAVLQVGRDGTPWVAANAAVAAAAVPAPSYSTAKSVAISLDSIPQDATVLRGSDGTPIGRTPIVVDMPAGREIVEFTFRKNGYEVVSLKVIPNQDKPVLVQLRECGPGHMGLPGCGFFGVLTPGIEAPIPPRDLRGQVK